jgi:asparagine synthetase B (glutamine-hydrolysing)
MCGIAGIAGSYSDLEESLMKNMLDLMEYRGPDESDITKTPKCLLGHKRLSIISPQDGIQPIPNETSNAWIVCNGEIYNYRQLKQEHLQKHRFHRNSDSEVALHLYEEYGKHCVDYLDGMFAFIISDDRGDQPSVFAARDPLGIKPLYCGQKNGKYYFASELKCIYGIVDKVIEFPPGHYFTLEDGFVPYRTVKIINNAVSPRQPSTLEEMLANIKSLLEKVVTMCSAFEDSGYLPEEILWRKKEEFSEGSGTKAFLEKTFHRCISDLELATEHARIHHEDGIEIRSKQELYFYRIFKTFYPDLSILNTIGRWAVA